MADEQIIEIADGEVSNEDMHYLAQCHFDICSFVAHLQDHRRIIFMMDGEEGDLMRIRTILCRLIWKQYEPEKIFCTSTNPPGVQRVVKVDAEVTVPPPEEAHEKEFELDEDDKMYNVRVFSENGILVMENPIPFSFPLDDWDELRESLDEGIGRFLMNDGWHFDFKVTRKQMRAIKFNDYIFKMGEDDSITVTLWQNPQKSPGAEWTSSDEEKQSSSK